jgi:hypothetical protein
MVKSLRHAKAVAMAASAVAINAASKKGFIETAVSLEKQARGIEALIEEQVSKAVEAVHEDAKKLQAVAKAYAAAAAEAAAAAKMRFRTSTVLRYEVLEDAADPGFVPSPSSIEVFRSFDSSPTASSAAMSCSSVD